MIGTQNKEYGMQATESEIKNFLNALNSFQDSSVRSPFGTCSLLLVSNEVGMGIVPENKIARKFRDMAGILNRTIAETADEVYMVVAGIPLKIKGER
jgi:adenosyl cobinamide kinase/adenosyl cobinamide phosphate guanylyltransferase